MPMPPLGARTIGDVVDAFLVDFKAFMDASTFTNTVTLKYQYDNLAFDPDKEFRNVPLEQQAWMSVFFRHTPGLSGQAALGDNLYRRFGTVLIRVYVRKDTGRVLLDELSDRAILFFETQALPGMSFENQSPAEQGGDAEEGWFVMDVASDFKYDTLRSA